MFVVGFIAGVLVTVLAAVAFSIYKVRKLLGP